MAVFGDDKRKTIKPENIRKLNIPLTLSEEYGVTFQAAFTVIAEFLFKILINDSVSEEIAEKIFIELLESFPTKKNKKYFGQSLLQTCLMTIENNKSNLSLLPKTEEKVNKLLQTTEIYNSEIQF